MLRRGRVRGGYEIAGEEEDGEDAGEDEPDPVGDTQQRPALHPRRVFLV
jgi:hypothetical protein